MELKVGLIATGAFIAGIVLGFAGSIGLAYATQEPVGYEWDEVPLSADVLEYDTENGSILLRVQNEANSAAPMTWVNMDNTSAYKSSSGDRSLWMATNEDGNLSAYKYVWPANHTDRPLETFWLAPYATEHILLRVSSNQCFDALIYRGDMWNEVFSPAMDPLVVPLPEQAC